MKYLLLFIFLSFNLSAQIFRIDSLPKQGIVLDKGWKWHAGDNPNFAKADFDDSAWQSIDPTKDIFDLPQLPKTGEIFWLRLHFEVDSSLNQQMVMMIWQSGASEIYLNGKLIHVFGVLSKNSKEIKALDSQEKPYSLPMLQGITQILALKCAFQPNILYATHFGHFNKAISITLFTPENLYEANKINQYDFDLNIVMGSIYIVLCLLYFAFYLFNKTQKINLYFTIFTCLNAFPYCLFGFSHYIVSIGDYFWYANVILILGVISQSFLLLAIYRLFDSKISIFYWITLAFGLICIPVAFIYYGSGWVFYGVGYNFMVSLEILRATINGILKNKKGAWIIAGGAFVFFCFWFLFLVCQNILSWRELGPYFYAIAGLGIPISVAIFIGYDFAQTNLSLQQKLDENEKLSEEKQQMLSTQNETLEKKVVERTAELELKNRELEIEGALERVRSRSLAMHKSDELQEVVEVVFEKLKELGLVFDGGAGIQLFVENSKDSVLWVAAPDQISSPSRVNLPYVADDFIDNPIIQDVWKAKETGEAIYNKTYNQEEKNKYFNYVFKHNDLIQVPQPVRDEIFQTPSYTQAFVVEKNSGVIANSWSGQIFPPNEFAIFKRIAKVFEQAYIRFLDLQKAEAQAREAQIEVALERIRSRSLAMHNPNELKEVMAVMFEKLTELEVLLGTVAVQIFDTKTKSCEFWVGNDRQAPARVILPYDENIMNQEGYMKDCWQAHDTGTSFFNKIDSFEEKSNYFKYVFANNDTSVVLPPIQEFILQAENHSNNLIIEKNSTLFFDSWSEKLYNESQIDVLKRVAKVFEQAYVRFLDLQKAEAQAREAQIEIALERVRSKTMAMQHSSELREIVAAIYEQLRNVGFTFGACSIVIMDKLTGDMDWWINGFETPYPESYRNTYFEHSFYLAQLNNWKEGKKYAVMETSGEDKKSYDEFVFSKTDFVRIPLETQNVMKSFKKITFSNAYIKYGALSWSTEPLDDTHANILQRFAYVFEQSYTRFLDLQKAEAQVRESQIEIALERVRSRTMAMHNSNELAEASFLLDSQVRELGIKTRGCGFNIYGENESTEWFSSELGTMPTYKTPRENIFLKYYEAGQRGETLLLHEFAGEECVAHYDYLCSLPVTGEGLRQFKASGGSFPTRQIDHVAYFKYGYLLFITLEPTLEAHDIFKRFAKIFEQTYTRFLDLQKAEAQALEAKVEAALERVRSRTMAMHNSNELTEAANLLFQQVQALGIPIWSCGYNIFTKDEKECIGWMSTNGSLQPPFKIQLKESPTFIRFYESKQKGEYFYVETIEGENLKKHYAYMMSLPDFKEIVEGFVKSGFSFPTFQMNHVVNFRQGNLIFITGQPIPESHDVLKRFAAVFEQTYTRFLDLQKAEAQAREAQIEVALEKIRSRSLSMHHSNELAEAASILFQQVTNLGVNAFASVFHIWQPDRISTMCWANGGDGMQPPLRVPHIEESFHRRIYDAWQRGEDFFVLESEGAELEATYRFLNKLVGGKEVLDNIEDSGFVIPKKQVTHCAFFLQGYIMFNTYEKVQMLHDIFKRFAKVFEQTYTRFLDLQKAEVQAREAQIEASLERIRSRAMEMNTSEELNLLISFIYAECTKLDMQLDRGFIMTFDKATKDAHWWMVSSEAPDMPISILVKNHEYAPNLAIIKAWQERKQKWSYLLEDDNKKTWDDYVFVETDLSQLPDFVKDSMRLVKSIILNASFQNFGCILLSSYEPLSEEHFDLLIRLSKVFDLTYTRFLDLQLKEQNAIKLLEEKQKLEQTLSELRSTQNQLIQKEKLASLGELTAGIAHEIQNPLNFVNNFSELSVDLVKDLKEEMDKSEQDKDYINELFDDLSSNQTKINHHGKRASNIVKGMLEHSRNTTGERVLTDINQLADEYLRLSFHGMKAKNKDFNADYKIDFDPTLPKIEVVPQEIGRVLLNLINNAFYAVLQRKTNVVEVSNLDDVNKTYTPSVVVSTQKLDNQIVIKVIDNGSGIPDNIKAKIFQPFFTTKPTGDGNTGLGLSLAYDIVTKGHGGTLEVVSVEGEGATFVVRLLM